MISRVTLSVVKVRTDAERYLRSLAPLEEDASNERVAEMLTSFAIAQILAFAEGDTCQPKLSH